MYLPRFKQTAPYYTKGEEYIISSTGENYIGYYVRTSSGEFYTGRSFFSKTSQKLQSVTDYGDRLLPVTEDYDVLKNYSPQQIQLKQTNPIPGYVYIPDRSLKTNVRFFARSKVTGGILEISSEDYLEVVNKTSKYHYPTYDVTLLNWDLTAPVDDTRIGSYIQEGSRSKNKKTAAEADKVLPGLYEYLSREL